VRRGLGVRSLFVRWCFPFWMCIVCAFSWCTERDHVCGWSFIPVAVAVRGGYLWAVVRVGGVRVSERRVAHLSSPPVVFSFPGYEQAALQAIAFLQRMYGFVVVDYNFQNVVL
jgi:hypothetical protein